MRDVLQKVTTGLVVLWVLLAGFLDGSIAIRCAFAGADRYSLTVLHTNDVHARVMPFTRLGNTCDEPAVAAGLCYGGVARLAAQISQVRSEGGNTVLVDGGDQFQGTLFYTKYKGGAVHPFMNAMGYEAMVVGNHEFDDGPDGLVDFIRHVSFPVLGANIDAGKDATLSGLIKPYTLVEKGSETIGILGYTTEDLPILSSPGPHVRINSIEDAVASALAELKKLGVNKIIALSHAGLDRDRQIASKFDGIDVIVGGHTHSFLSNTDPNAEGPYPIVENSPDGNPVLIVSDSAWGKYLGRLDVTFDENGVPIAWKGEPILMDAGVSEDPEVLATVRKMNESLETLQKQIIGRTIVDLTDGAGKCRFEECALGNLIADAMIWATAAQGTQIAVQNGGGIRAGIPSGNITLGAVLEVLPFGNTVSTMEMKGADIMAALENGVSRAHNPAGEGTGRFLQVAGLKYVWSATRPVGSRLITVEVGDSRGGYERLNPEKTYRVAVNDFLRRGGDGYEVFAEKAIQSYDFGPTLDEVLAKYIAAHSPIRNGTNGRISRDDQSAHSAGSVSAAGHPAAASR